MVTFLRATLGFEPEIMREGWFFDTKMESDLIREHQLPKDWLMQRPLHRRTIGEHSAIHIPIILQSIRLDRNSLCAMLNLN